CLVETAAAVLGYAAVLNQFHAEVVPAVVLADLVNGHDVRMIEVGDGSRFGAEALHFRRGRQLAGEDHLQGDDAVEGNLPGPVDDAHAAAADLAQQLVVAEGAHRVGSRVGEALLVEARALAGHRSPGVPYSYRPAPWGPGGKRCIKLLPCR